MNIYPDEELVEENPDLAEPNKSTDLTASPETDEVGDTNVPTLQETTDVSNENPNGGNNAQSEGYTNEDAGITD